MLPSGYSTFTAPAVPMTKPRGVGSIYAVSDGVNSAAPVALEVLSLTDAIIPTFIAYLLY